MILNLMLTCLVVIFLLLVAYALYVRKNYPKSFTISGGAYRNIDEINQYCREHGIKGHASPGSDYYIHIFVRNPFALMRINNILRELHRAQLPLFGDKK